MAFYIGLGNRASELIMSHTLESHELARPIDLRMGHPPITYKPCQMAVSHFPLRLSSSPHEALFVQCAENEDSSTPKTTLQWPCTEKSLDIPFNSFPFYNDDLQTMHNTLFFTVFGIHARISKGA
jgi:hypothetical protein